MEIQDFSPAYNQISRTFLERFAREEPGKNIVFSPFSILMLLGICASSSAGETREEIRRAIGGDIPFGALQDVLAQLQFDLTESGTFLSSNAVCVRQDIRDSVPARYETMLDTVYAGRVFAGEDMAELVNNWVRENTRGLIDRIADDSMSRMLACLLNAAAFEAEWASPYQENQIRKDRFTNADGSVSEAEMLRSSESRYLENAVATGFIRPYRDFGFSFMALLPKEEGREALSGLLASPSLTELFRSAEHATVQAEMPEFRYSFDRDISGICQDLGIRLAFTGLADFTPLSSVPQLGVNSILHKAVIQVDRHGTKAAAVTAAILRQMSARPQRPKIVRLDRPFLWSVIHNETGLPLFCGVVNSLKK